MAEVGPMPLTWQRAATLARRREQEATVAARDLSRVAIESRGQQDGAQGGSHAGLGAQETVFLGDAQREKLATSGAEGGEFLEGRLQSGGGRGWKQTPVVAEDASVDGIGLGELALGAGEVADLTGLTTLMGMEA